jgi:hypothetical protein
MDPQSNPRKRRGRAWIDRARGVGARTIDAVRSALAPVLDLMRVPWVRYALGVVLVQLLLIYLYFYANQDGQHIRFYQVVRDVGKWGILVAFVYKEIVVGLMLLTRPKTPLDRRWIWQTQAMALLMLQAFVTFQYPTFLGRHVVAWSVVWFNVWMQILWSSAEVLYYLWRERGRWAWAYLVLLIDSWFAGPRFWRRRESGG